MRGSISSPPPRSAWRMELLYHLGFRAFRPDASSRWTISARWVVCLSPTKRWRKNDSKHRGARYAYLLPPRPSTATSSLRLQMIRLCAVQRIRLSTPCDCLRPSRVPPRPDRSFDSCKLIRMMKGGDGRLKMWLKRPLWRERFAVPAPKGPPAVSRGVACGKSLSRSSGWHADHSG